MRRVHAQDIARRLASSLLPTDRLGQELDAFEALLDWEAASHTVHGWQADANHVRGGWPTLHRDEKGMALARGAIVLRELQMAAERLIDASAAARMAALIKMDVE